ncbi:MAG: lysylphosphatidylglycerol synthase domain-containing protein [Marmoricola sp.]
MTLHKVLHSRVLLVLGTILALAVPVATLPRLPHVSPWPLLIAMVPWVLAKYLLCPLRWRLLTPPGPDGRQSNGWHLRAYAEAELIGLATPGHVGADVWRMRRLTRGGLSRGDAVLSVGLDRLVGAVGLTVFLAFAATDLDSPLVIVALAVGVVLVVGALLARQYRPSLLPSGPLPSMKALALGLLISAAFQISIAGLLLGAIAATGNSLSLWAIFGAFGASQLAGAVPGPNGASPREAALVVALAALGVPWLAATAAVTLKAALAWLPALMLGGISLILLRRQTRALSRLSVAAL